MSFKVAEEIKTGEDNDVDPSTELSFGRTVVPVADNTKLPAKDKLGFEYAEHCFIGDAIKLTLANEQVVSASSNKFLFPNKLFLTYGQINGLAGDFYGTSDPISDGESDMDRTVRFMAAYNTLAGVSSRQPDEAVAILAVLQAEVDAVNQALQNHEDPSVVYSQLPDVSTKLQVITLNRLGSGIPTYLGLAQINWDHFGDDARTAYNAGHGTALQLAASGDLNGAYMLNAFADHFLEDSFSAGHLRTPRRSLHGPVDATADLCAKYMHDEDNAIGINVTNPNGQSWTCYGDKRALDQVDQSNLTHCIAAVQASADEVYLAFRSKKVPPPSSYAAWNIAPTLASARATNQTLATLFTFQSGKRANIERRRDWIFTNSWWFSSTAAQIKISGWWNYPITIDGPGVSSVIPYTSIGVAVLKDTSFRVFYQAANGAILQSEHDNGVAKSPIESHDYVVPAAALFTPLASISWNDGDEIRVYYLDKEYKIQERCYSSSKGWYAGEINKLGITVSYKSRLSAVYFDKENIRVYYQDIDSKALAEACFSEGKWFKGSKLPVALDGSSIAATVISGGSNVQSHIRVYYQEDDLSLKEVCFDGNAWASGQFNPGKAPGRTPICGLSVDSTSGTAKVQVYWREINDQVVVAKFATAWATPVAVLQGLKSGYQFNVLQWGAGQFLRLYHQTKENSAGLDEHASDTFGDEWASSAK